MILLFDVSNIAHRVYHSVHQFSADGSPCGIPVGFFRLSSRVMSNLRLIYHNEPIVKIACFDYGRCAWRTEAYPAYKAGRKKPSTGDFLPQMEELENALVNSFGFIPCKSLGVEADDFIGVTSQEFETKTNETIVIVSSDKDLWQLITDRVKIYDLQTNALVGAEQAEEQLGFSHHRLVEHKSISGDTSDNIPGAKGIGDKGAAEILKSVTDVRQLIANVKTRFEVWLTYPESDTHDKIKEFANRSEAELFVYNSDTDGHATHEIKEKTIPISPTLLKKVAASVDDILLAGRLCTIAQYPDQLWTDEARAEVNRVVNQTLGRAYAPADETSIFGLAARWNVNEPDWGTAFL